MDVARAPMRYAIQQVSEKLREWWETLLEMLPNIAVALVVVLLFWAFGRLASRVLGKILGQTHLAESGASIITKLTTFSFVLIGLAIALGVLQLTQAATSLLAGAGIVGLAIGLAFQDIAANYFAGLMLSFRQPIRPGHVVETNGFMGVVEKIELRTTWLRSFEGQRIIIPNRKIFTESLTNYSIEHKRRVSISVGISYADDLEVAERATREAVERLPMRKPEEPVRVFFKGFGESSIDLEIQFWIDFKAQSEWWTAQHEAIKAVKRAFDANGLTIPFPIRTLDFGIRGGVPLRGMLEPTKPNAEARWKEAR